MRRTAGDLERHLATRPGIALHDVAATLQIGRVAFEHRLAIIAGSVAQLREQLALVAAGEHASGVQRGTADPDARPAPPVSPAPDADLAATAREWAAGASLDFRSLYEGGAVRRINLPGYAYARDRCWLPDAEAPATPAAAASPAASEPPPAPTPARTPPATPRQAVVSAAAAQLGLPEGELDTAIPSDELGFDVAGRTRLVDHLNLELGMDLRPDAFPVRASLAELAERVAGAGREAPFDARVPSPPAPLDGDPAGAVDALVAQAEEYLKTLLAAEGRLPLDRIRTTAPLQEYGIESVLITKLNERLQEAIDGLPTTLFFEYRTIRGVAEYLAREHADRLVDAIGERHAEPPATPTPTPPPEPGPGPSRRPDRAPAATEEIAVIGMAGRYPMAADNAELWSNLLAARDCIVEVPADRWDHAAYVSDDPDAPGRTYARWGGFVDDVDKFDPLFFNIAPKDAESMDPQQRLFLETAWAALEDAGYTPQRVRDSARRRGRRTQGCSPASPTASTSCSSHDARSPAVLRSVANRVSYHLDLNGPSMAVDTACSSSLTATAPRVREPASGRVRAAPSRAASTCPSTRGSTCCSARVTGRRPTAAAARSARAATATCPARASAPSSSSRSPRRARDGDRIYGVIRGERDQPRRPDERLHRAQPARPGRRSSSTR